MKFIALIFVAALTFTSCKKKFPEETPECIVTKAEAGDLQSGYKYKEVYKYVKKDGQGVTDALEYYRFVSEDETAQYDELVDRTCNLVCNPQHGVWSGLTGDCASPLFNDPQEWTLLWVNPEVK